MFRKDAVGIHFVLPAVWQKEVMAPSDTATELSDSDTTPFKNIPPAVWQKEVMAPSNTATELSDSDVTPIKKMFTCYQLSLFCSTPAEIDDKTAVRLLLL